MRLPELVDPAVFPLDPDHPDVALATINRFLLALVDGLQENVVGIDDLRLVAQSLTKLSTDYLAALQASLADRADLRAIVTSTRDNLAAEITRATQAEAALSARIAALEARTLRGTTGTGTVSSLIAGNTNLTITLKTPMPSADYIALPVIDATTGVNLSTVTATVTARTVTNVTVRVTNSGLALLQTVNVTVIAVQLA